MKINYFFEKGKVVFVFLIKKMCDSKKEIVLSYSSELDNNGKIKNETISVFREIKYQLAISERKGVDEVESVIISIKELYYYLEGPKDKSVRILEWILFCTFFLIIIIISIFLILIYELCLLVIQVIRIFGKNKYSFIKEKLRTFFFYSLDNFIVEY